MSTFKDTFNPTLDTLIRSFGFISENEPVAMDSIPLCRHAGYKWLWGMKDHGWLKIGRSTDDGRSHLVSLTIEGRIVHQTLMDIKASKDIFCHKCGNEIDRFFRVPNKAWKQVTGDEHDQVVCRSCYEILKKRKK